MKKCIKRLISLCVFSVSIQSSLADDKCDIVGAGVLPYFFDDNGGINVLLGHQKGRGWSSFGGGPKKVESVNNPESRCEKHKEIALREGVEEMRYLISRELLSDLLTDAKSYPSHPKRNDFINYLIKVDKFSKDHYFSTVVL